MRTKFGSSIVGAVVLTLLLGGARQAEAVIIFDNMGPAPESLKNQATTIADDPTLDFYQEIGWSLISPGAFTFQDFRIAIGTIEGLNAVDVTLHDDAGGLPGNPLESFTFSDQMLPLFGDIFDGQPPILSASSLLTPTLLPGERYWFVATPYETTQAGWRVSELETAGDTLGAFRSDPNDPFNSMFGFRGGLRVDGIPLSETVIPEPSSLLLLGAGLLGLAGRCRRFRV